MRMTIFLIVCFISCVLAFGYFMGAFKRIEIRSELSPDYVLVFKKITGAYTKSSAVMDQIYEWLRDQGIESDKGFGLYYDNPNEVKEADLRSVVGCILRKKDHNRIEDIAKKFHVKHFAATHSITTSFPYKNKLSVFLGVLKVYPAFTTIKGPVMEVYDISKNRIDYYQFPNQLDYLLTEYYDAY